MSRAMTFREFNDLLILIAKNHSMLTGTSGFRVKYIYPSIDMRTNSVFAVRLNSGFSEVFLHTQNECRDMPETLFERCVAVLKGECYVPEEEKHQDRTEVVAK